MSDAALSVQSSGRFALGRWRVHRAGFGAMQLAGPYAFGPPPDRETAIGVLRAAVAAGADHIDTAEYYGPGVVNDLIREALHPYPNGLAIVSKVAVRRDDGGAVLPFDDPDQLREGIEDNLRSLRIDQLAAVNLRLPGDGRIDARFDDQLAAMVAARESGLIAGVGLSNVSLEQLRTPWRGPTLSASRTCSISPTGAIPRFSRSASAAASRTCRSARSAGHAAGTTPYSPALWSPGRRRVSASHRPRWRSNGCFSWPPTCSSSLEPVLSLTCEKTWLPTASRWINRRCAIWSAWAARRSGRHQRIAQGLYGCSVSYSSWRRKKFSGASSVLASLRPRGARSSHWYMPHRPSSPRA